MRWKVMKEPEGIKRETGLEPATSTLGRLHSTIELLPRNYLRYYRQVPAVNRASLMQPVRFKGYAAFILLI
jgi:hypothetical protein